MQYKVGQALRWVPTYFKWDAPADVTVVHIYRNGCCLLSNEKIADEDGFIQWYGRIAGRVEEDAKA